MKGLLVAACLLTNGQVFAASLDDYKEMAREFFQGQRPIVEAVNLTMDVELDEPATDIGEDLFESLEAHCNLRLNKGVYKSSLSLSGDTCVMPGKVNTGLRLGNGFRAEDAKWSLKLEDEMFTALTGRTAFDGRRHWSAQEYINGRFEGEVTESSRTQLLDGELVHFHGRAYMQGYRDMNGQYLVTLWQLRSQLDFEETPIQINANFDQYGRHCEINGRRLHCDEMLDILGGKEAELLKHLRLMR